MSELTVRNEAGQTFKVDEARVSEAEKDGFLPVVSNGSQEHRVSYKDLELAKNDGFKPLVQKTSQVESALRGFAQGAAFEFADEVAGAGEAIGKAAFGDDKLSEIGSNYKKYRDESRANFKKAEIDNPSTYKTAEIGGAIASAAIPMGAANTLGRAALAGARAGVIGSVGASEADNAAQLVEDAGKGAAFGAAGGGIGYGATKAFIGARKSVSEAADYLGNKFKPIASKESGSVPIQNSGAFSEAAESAKNRLKSYFNPEVDPKFQEFAEIAKKNGIDPNLLPESVKFGPESSASRASRNLAEGRFGEETLKRFNQTLDQVRGAYNNKINLYSKGVPTDEVTAGKILRDAYDEGVSKFFDQMDLTHNSIMQQVPGLQVTEASQKAINSSLDGIEKFAKGRAIRGVTDTQKKQGQQLLNAVEAIRSGNGSYKQTVEALRDIGEAAFQSKNSMADIPVDTQKMRKIYNDLNDALIGSVRSQLGDDIANSLVQNNKLMSEFFGEKSLVAGVLGDKSISPENAFKSLILNGDSQRINALKKVISPEKWDYLKGAVLENLAKRDAEQNFAFKQLYNSMRSKRNTLSSIFTPQELADSVGVVRLGDRFGNPVLSSSGTGASLSFKDLTKSLSNLSVDAFALKNANNAAKRATQKAAEEAAPKVTRDVTPQLKQLPTKAAGVLLGSPIKGSEKWVNDGATKLEQSGLDPQEIEQLKKSKSGRELLIEASDAKPNSQRMKSVLKRIGSLKEAN